MISGARAERRRGRDHTQVHPRLEQEDRHPSRRLRAAPAHRAVIMCAHHATRNPESSQPCHLLLPADTPHDLRAASVITDVSEELAGAPRRW